MVLCREDSSSDGTPGRYVVATQKEFSSFKEAQHYASTISSSRESKIVKEIKMRFQVTISIHNMPSVQLVNPTELERKFIVNTVCCNRMDDERYKLRQRAGAFLQSDSADYVLVEFWQKDYQPFVDWLNANFDWFVNFWKGESY